MDKSLIIQSLLETFLTEFDERLHAMSRDLLALESSDLGDAERNKRLQDLLRNAHSLKGAARAVDVKLIEEACHRLEDILSAVRSHPNLLDPHLIQLFFGVLDGLAEAGKLLRKQESLDESLLFGVSLEMEMFIETTIAPLGPIDKNKTAVPGVREPAKQTMPTAPGKGIPADNPDGAEGGTRGADRGDPDRAGLARRPGGSQHVHARIRLAEGLGRRLAGGTRARHRAERGGGALQPEQLQLGPYRSPRSPAVAARAGFGERGTAGTSEAGATGRARDPPKR